MSCEAYRQALIEAAASGTQSLGALGAHLQVCADCRAALTREQSLFASIDASLRTAANSDVPPSLLARVRTGLNDVAVAPRLRWLQPLAFASASIAVVLLVFLIGRPHRATPDKVAKQGPVVVPAPIAPRTSSNPRSIPAAGAQMTATDTKPFRAARSSTSFRSAASSYPEVLVPPDERQAFARLVARLNESGDVATALFARTPEKKDSLESLDFLQIADIQIKPLAGGETEALNDVGQKR